MARKGREDRGLFEETVPCKPCGGQKGNKDCKKCKGTGKAGTGVWWIRYAVPDQDGGPAGECKEKIGPKSLARDVYQKRKTEIREGRYFPPTRTRKRLLKDAVEDYLKKHSAGRSSEKDDKTYAKFWTTELGDRSLESIKPSDVEACYRNLGESGMARSTANHRVKFLRRLFNIEIRDQAAAAAAGRRPSHPLTNPCTLVKLAKEDNLRDRYLLDEEQERLRNLFLSAAKINVPAAGKTRPARESKLRPSEWPILEFAILTGLRQEEQFGLQWSDIDFQAETICVRGHRAKSEQTRYVPIHPRALDILKNMPSRWKSNWVFVGSRGQRIDPHNFTTRTFRPALEAAKIEDFHWHDLRHTFASRLAMEGVELYEIARLLGHADTTMTQRYAHLSPKRLRSTVHKLPWQGHDPAKSDPSSAKNDGGKSLNIPPGSPDAIGTRIGSEDLDATEP